MNKLRALYRAVIKTVKHDDNILSLLLIILGVVACPVWLPILFTVWFRRSIRKFAERMEEEAEQIEIKTKKVERESGQLSISASEGGELSEPASDHETPEELVERMRRTHPGSYALTYLIPPSGDSE